MKPRIAIPVPTTTDLEYNARAWPQYATAIERSGGEPVELKLNSPDLREQAKGCDGFCLPGSPADVDPTRYAADRDPATAPADPAREAMDTLLLEEAERAGKPVLAICFGVQFLNVWRGGSLVQDLSPLPVNHAAGGKVAVAHSILVAEDSLLASLLDPAEAPADGDFLRLPINTSHHQSVASPGEGLRIVARCPDDGVVEAIENKEDSQHFLIGVQWHPERSYEISAASRALFDRLVAEAQPFAEIRLAAESPLAASF